MILLRRVYEFLEIRVWLVNPVLDGVNLFMIAVFCGILDVLANKCWVI